MKPNILGVWLPIEIARMGFPDNLEVEAVVLRDPRDSHASYRIQCPDMRRAINDVWAATTKTNPEKT